MTKIESKSEPEVKNILQPLDLNPEQQALLFGDLRGKLFDYMCYETKDLLTPKLRESMNVLREVAGRMVINLGYDKIYSPVEFVTLGLVKFVSMENLEKLATEEAYGPSEEEFNGKVNFYLNQKRSEERRNLV